MPMGFGEVLVDMVQQRFLRRVPEGRVMIKSTIVTLPHLDHLIRCEGFPFVKSKDALGDADGVIEHAEGVYLSVEAEAFTQTPNLVGEAGAQEEQAIAIDDGLIQWSDIERGG